jgi:hypothetical protein
MDKKWFVHMSNDDENWDCSEEFDTKDEAIAYGKYLIIEDRKLPEDEQEYYDKESFDVGQYKQFKPRINMEVLIEWVQERAYDICEDRDDYLNDVKPEYLAILDTSLNEVFQKWLDKYDYNPNFGEIVNIETINMICRS